MKKYIYPIWFGKKYVITYLLTVFLLVFVTNILLHIIPGKAEVQYQEFQIEGISGYSIDENRYIPTNNDPQIYVKYNAESIVGLYLEFTAPLPEETIMQVYYPDSNINYSESNSSVFVLPAESTKIELCIPKAENGVLRLDINGEFQLSSIAGNTNVESAVAFLYTDRVICIICWFICFIIGYLICSVLYQFTFIREFAKRKLEFIHCFAQKIKSTLFLVLCTILTTIFVGCCIEFLLCTFAQRAFNVKEFYIVAAILLFLISLVKLKIFYKEKIELVVFGVLFLLGIIFSLDMPVAVGLSWDDQTHYNKIIADARFNSGYGSVAENKFSDDLADSVYDRISRKEKDRELNILYGSGKVVNIQTQPFTIKDLGYIPAIIGTWLSYGLCLPFTATIIVTRITNVIFFAVMVALSMKNVRSGKMLIAVFAFIPTVFFLASSFSYDTWLTVLLIYGFSKYFRELQYRDEPLNWRRFWGIFLPLFLSLGPKPVYAPILFLTAYMPREKFQDKKWCYAYRLCFILAALIMLFGLWYIITGRFDLGVGDLRGGSGVNPMGQLAYIRENFSEFGLTLATFLKSYFSYGNCVNYLTFMAYMGAVNMPFISIVLLLFTALTDRMPQDKKTIPMIMKVGAVIMYVIIGGICALSMYIIFTPVGELSINGCQGRYIIPAILPVLYIISRCGYKIWVRQRIKVEYYNMALLVVSVTFLMYNLWINCVVKY